MSFSKLFIIFHTLIFLFCLAGGLILLFPHWIEPEINYAQTDFEYTSISFLVMAFGILLYPFWTEYRLRRWAHSHDCILLQTRTVWPWNNPFGWASTASDNIVTYEVTVRDTEGVVRRAWVKFGKFWYPSLYVEDLWE